MGMLFFRRSGFTLREIGNLYGTGKAVVFWLYCQTYVIIQRTKIFIKVYLGDLWWNRAMVFIATGL